MKGKDNTGIFSNMMMSVKRERSSGNGVDGSKCKGRQRVESGGGRSGKDQVGLFAHVISFAIRIMLAISGPACQTWKMEEGVV